MTGAEEQLKPKEEHEATRKRAYEKEHIKSCKRGKTTSEEARQ